VNSGGVTLGNGGDAITFDGGVTSNASTTTINGTLATSNDDATFGSITLAGDTVINTGTGVGDISIATITGGTKNLQLISGSGTTTVSGGATGLGTVTLQEDAATSTGNVAFQAGLTAAAITTFARPYAVTLQGGTTTITNASTFLNTSSLTVGSAGDTSTFSNGLTAATQSAVNLAGVIEATDTPISLGDITLTANTTIGSGTGAINIASATTPSAFSLNLGNASQTGTVTFTGNASLNNSSLNAAAGAFDMALGGPTNTIGSGTFLNTGSLTVGTAGGTSTFSNGLTAVTQSAVKLTGLIQTTGTQSYGKPVNATANTTLSAIGMISFASTLNTDGNLTLNTNGGNLTLGTDTMIRGSLSANTNNGAISQLGPLTVQGSTTLSTGNGNITLMNRDNIFAKVPLTISSTGAIQIYPCSATVSCTSLLTSQIQQAILETNTGLNQNRQITSFHSNPYQATIGESVGPQKANFAVQTQRNERYVMGQSSLQINAGKDVCLSVDGCSNQDLIVPGNPTETPQLPGERRLSIRGIDQQMILPKADILLKAAENLGKAYNTTKAHLQTLTHWLQSQR
jgi:hypothetical protein